jgi:hypothetical protein
MSNFAGEVSTLQGVVRAVNPETGEARVLEKGSPIFAGEVIVTSPIGGVLINMQNGEQLTLGRDTKMLIDGDVAYNASVLDAATEGAVDVAALQQAVLEGNFDALEVTAAGEVAIPGSVSDGGVVVERIGWQDEVTSGFDTTTTSPVVKESTQEVITLGARLNTVLTLNDISLKKGSQTGTITATLNAAPTDGPIVFALNNGATITFEIGQTETTSTPFELQGDDVSVDGEEILLSATVQSGGDQFAGVDVTDTATVTVIDTITPVTVELSATGVPGGNYENVETGQEATAQITDTIVTLDDDQSITTATGGNFESLVVDTQVEQPILTLKIDEVDVVQKTESYSNADINSVTATGSTSVYEYNLDISASLQDTDSLSDVTDNEDSTYNIGLQSADIVASDVKITATQELIADELRDLHAAVTSTESNGEDTAATEVDGLGDSFLHGSAEDDVFLLENDAHETSVTHIDDFDVDNDTLDLSEIIGDTVTEETLGQYFNFTYIDSDGADVTESGGVAVDTKITVDADGDNTTTDDISTIYIQDNNQIDDISDLNIDYQNE